MPYVINGRVVDTDGNPINSQAVQIEEISPSPGGSVWADQTGKFSFAASSSTAMVKISSNFYKPKVALAKMFQGNVVLEEDAVVIEHERPTSNALWLVLAGLAAATVAAMAHKQRNNQQKAKTVKEPKEVVI